MSKVKSGSEGSDLSGKRWASTVTISDNAARQGVELQFDSDPHPEFQSKLRVAGFLPSKSPGMWYAKATANTRQFADNVKMVIAMAATGPDMFIQPSYEPNKANIESKRFSFVQISLKSGQDKTFIVFEPSKPRAEVIASNFAYRLFRTEYLALAVNPRTRLREARMLFDEGRIIRETGEHDQEEGVASQRHNEPESELTENNGAVTVQETIGGEKANLSVILHQFHTWLKDHPDHKGSTKIGKPVYIAWLREHYPQLNTLDTEKLWDRHQRLVKIMNRIGNLDTKQIVAEPYSSIYKKLIKIIPELPQYLNSGKLFAGKSISHPYMDLHVDFLYKDKEGYNLALAHYYKQNGDLVPDPDMRVRVMPETNLAEAMSFQDYRSYNEVYSEQGGRDMVNLEMKKKLNAFLNQWLTNLISQEHIVKLASEDDDESQITATNESSPSIEAAEALANENGIFSPETAGKNYEELPVSMPADTYDVTVLIVQSGEQEFRGGYYLKKLFGQVTTIWEQPTLKGIAYRTKAEAINEVLALLITAFRSDQENVPKKDQGINVEAKVETAINALLEYGELRDLSSTDLLFRAKSPLLNVNISDAVAVPHLNASGTKGGPTDRISFATYANLSEILQAADTEILYYDAKAWRVYSTEYCLIQRMPELDTEAVKYYKQVYQKTPGYLQKQQGLVKNGLQVVEAPQFTANTTESQPEHIYIGKMEPIPGMKVDVTNLSPGEIKPITFPAFDAIGMVLKYAKTRAFKYEGKTWTITATASGDPIMHELVSEQSSKLNGAASRKSTSKATPKEENYLPSNDDPELDRIAFSRLVKIIPQLEDLLRGAKTQGTLKYELFGESKELTCFIEPDRHSLFLVEELNGTRQMESDITIDLSAKEARVTSEWLSDYYAEGLGRLEGNIEFEGDDMGLGRDMTRGLIQWMQDLIEESLTVHIDTNASEKKQPLAFLDEPVIDNGLTGRMEFNPFAVASFIAQNPDLSDDWRHLYDAEEVTVNKDFTKAQILRLKEFYNTYILEHEEEEKHYRELLYKLDDPSFAVIDAAPVTGPEPKLLRTYTPEEEKAILLAFDELGFKSPFTVKEAIDRKLPVIDLCFRYYDTEQYFKNTYRDPLTEQIRHLEAESRNKSGKVKIKTDQDKARQSKITTLSIKLVQAEKTYQDEFIIFQDDFILYVFQRAKAAGYLPSGQDQLTNFQLFIAESVFDGRTIENYPREPINKLVDELISDFFHPNTNSTDTKTEKRPMVQVVDLIRFGTLAPNVIVPAGTKEPFITGEFSLYDMKETIKTSFPHLRKITNKTLSEATPHEMWELAQMSHPTDYGVKVDRQAMLEEWERRGKKMFVDLGLPVDPEYPYVNANLGYESVEPLNQILFDHNKEGNQWWAVADNWRPIGDLDKALVFIDSQIATVQHGMDEKTNSKNGKPHGSQKDQHRQLQFIMRDLQDGRKFITDYIAKNKFQHPLTQEPESIEEHNASVMPVYINDAIAVADYTVTAPAQEDAHKRQISEKALITLQDKLKQSNSDLLYYQGGAFTILQENGEPYLVERPDLEAMAANYFEGSFKASTEYKNREKKRVKDFKKDLEAAEWKGNDYRDEIDRITINAVVYHRVRLLAAVLEGFRYLFVSDQMHLVNSLHQNYNKRPKLEYQDAFGKADPGIRVVAQAYVKDTIIENDFIGSNAYGDRYYSALKGVLLDLSTAIPAHEPIASYGKVSAKQADQARAKTSGKSQAGVGNDKAISSESANELVDLPVQPKPSLKKIQKPDQYKLNMEIETLIDERDAKGESFSSEEKELIRQYAGSGGLLKQGAKGRGVLYEYFTPEWLVEQMWELARKYGYDGGSVLEPSVGTGNFLKYAPKEAIVFGFETNHYSARIAQVLYPHAHIHEKAFESLFFAGNIHLKDKIDHPLYSLVIGNPPYGEFTGKYAGMGEKKWTGALEYDQYFMLRGLDLLQPGGLLVFLVPSLFIQSGQKYNKTKDKIFEKAEVLTCYRLPQNIFATTDIGTDIIVLRKRGTISASKNKTEGIDMESLPTMEAKQDMNCDVTGLAIHFGDRVFYDKVNNRHIKALKIKDGNNQVDLLRKNPWLPKIIKEAFSNYMAKHGHRNELKEKYYSEDAIYDPRLIVDATVDYIHEVMKDDKVTSCWLHKIDITEAFAD